MRVGRCGALRCSSAVRAMVDVGARRRTSRGVRQIAQLRAAACCATRASARGSGTRDVALLYFASDVDETVRKNMLAAMNGASTP